MCSSFLPVHGCSACLSDPWSCTLAPLHVLKLTHGFTQAPSLLLPRWGVLGNGQNWLVKSSSAFLYLLHHLLDLHVSSCWGTHSLSFPGTDIYSYNFPTSSVLSSHSKLFVGIRCHRAFTYMPFPLPRMFSLPPFIYPDGLSSIVTLPMKLSLTLLNHIHSCESTGLSTFLNHHL